MPFVIARPRLFGHPLPFVWRRLRYVLLGACGLLAGLTVTAWARSHPPPTTFVRLSTGQGLSQSTAQCLTQDNQGFLWIGTQDGLNRYDGYTFQTFRADPTHSASLSDNYITALCATPTGLWIGTQHGLNRYDPVRQVFTRFYARAEDPQSLAHDRITALGCDARGGLWVGTPHGLHRWEGERFTRFPYQDDSGLAESLNVIRAIVPDATGTLWLGTNGGLCRFDPSSGKFTPALVGQRVLALQFDRQGKLWLVGQGLTCYEPDRGRVTHFRHDPRRPDSLASDQTRAVVEDARGRLWVGTWGSGLSRLETENDGGRFTHFRHNPRQPTSLGHDFIWQLVRDQAGTVWIGTDFGGLNQMVEGRFAIHDANPDRGDRLSDGLVWSLTEDRRGNLWVGTNQGLNCLDPQGGIRHYLADHRPGQLNHGIVGALLTTRDGTLWAGTEQGGLHRLDATANRFTSLRHQPGRADGLSDDWVHALCETRAGELWVGTQRGLDRVDPPTQRVVDRRPRRPDEPGRDAIWAIQEDPTGALWLGTERGLFRWQPQTRQEDHYWHDPSRPDSLTHDWVLALHLDRKGSLWAGTPGGLNRFQPDHRTFVRYTTAQGLPNNVINVILEDEAGHLWLGTNHGLCRFDPETETCRTYDLRDGLPSNEISTAAGWRSADGWLHMGTTAGFFSFHPSQLVDNAFIPPVAITSFRIFDRPAADFDAARGVTLTHRENFFAFEFAALNFIAPEKNQYAYRLEGFDRDWVLCGTRRYAGYTNLDPGDYVFQVRAANNDGVWNDQGVRLRLRILPPFWRTGWAYALYTVASLGLVLGLYQLQVRRWRSQAAWREAQLQMQATQAARDAADARAQAAEAQAQAAAVQAQAAQQLAERNRELEARNAELIASQRRADRMFSALADALPGTTLDDKYRLDEKIGAGGFGAVFRGTHLTLGYAVAVKVFKPIAGNDSAEALERFRREGVAISRLDHPNIVRVMDSGLSQDGIAYLVMELLTGHSLRHELCGRLPLRRVVSLLIPVCRALDEAHRQGIVHRDIKPDNVFLHQTPRGEIVKVVDFGIAKLIGAGRGEDDLTATGAVIGTPTYVAPERVAGQPYDGKSDVYSVGVMAYEMLAGHLPFPATDGNPFAVLLAHLNVTPPPLRQFVPELPAGVVELVNQALSKDPALRPSAAELGTRLVEVIQHVSGSFTDESMSDDVTQAIERPTLPLGADTGDHGLKTHRNLTVSPSLPPARVTHQGTPPEAAPTLIADESSLP
ncbi:MAG: two-component regulator propeller domain-containing protein [Chloracidobacterium sp.]